MEATVRNLFMFFQLAVLAKLLFYMAQSGGGLPRNVGGRPNILFYSAGGNNLEVTWLALSSVFFLRRFTFYPVTANCFLTSVMYLSRVGVLVTGVAAAYRSIRVRPALTLLILGVMGPLLAIVFASTVNWRASEMLDRFVSIGDKEEYGSQSRMDLWIAAIDLVRHNPWGYGIGTGMEAVKNTMQETVHQNNVHNIFLQIALDCGVQSLLCFLYLMFDIARRWYNRGASNPYGTFVLLFLLPSLIEFTGQEALTWMFVGMFYGTIDVPNEDEELEAIEKNHVVDEDDAEEDDEVVEEDEKKPEPVVAVVDRPM
jgi:O-antigen ligase